MNKITNFLFEKEYKYRCVIEECSRGKTVGSFIASRVMASALSVFALINLVYDLVNVTYHCLASLFYSIIHLKSPLKYCSTTRNIGIVAVEFFRHLFGTFAGSLIGIATPKYASKWFLPSNQSAMETRKENMTQEQAHKLYEMTGVVHDAFVEAGIEYCMTGGTQLGAARHDGIIPWDDDVDLFVLEKDAEKIKDLEAKLREKGIGMIRCHLGYKFFDLQGKDIAESHAGTKYEYKYPFIDICFAGFDDKQHITYIGEHFRQNYAGEYLTKTEWRNRTLQKFGPLTLYGAPEPEKFCKRMYGEDVFNYGYQLLNHRTFKMEIPKKYYLEKNENGKCRSILEVIPDQV